MNINECRVLQVSLVLRFKFKTDLIINWIYPIKTHSRETWGKSIINLVYHQPFYEGKMIFSGPLLVIDFSGDSVPSDCHWSC